jgi:hypothetical protein
MEALSMSYDDTPGPPWLVMTEELFWHHRVMSIHDQSNEHVLWLEAAILAYRTVPILSHRVIRLLALRSSITWLQQDHWRPLTNQDSCSFFSCHDDLGISVETLPTHL